MIIFTFLPLQLLFFSIIWNTQAKIEYFHFRNFDWLTKIAHILDGGGGLLKKTETIISILETFIVLDLYFILI